MFNSELGLQDVQTLNQHRPIRATLSHLDGQTSQIIMSIPCYSAWSSYEETACMLLKEYCNILASKCIKISKFIIEMGNFNKSGKFIVSASYKESLIPIGKVFVKGSFGEWIDYNTAYNADAERQCIALENGGRIQRKEFQESIGQMP